MEILFEWTRVSVVKSKNDEDEWNSREKLSRAIFIFANWQSFSVQYLQAKNNYQYFFAQVSLAVPNLCLIYQQITYPLAISIFLPCAPIAPR